MPSCPRTRRHEIRVWNADQLRQFLAGIAGDELGPLYALVAATGLRRGEASALRWREVDIERRTLLVDRQRVSDAYSMREDEPKTHRGRRRLSLDEATVDMLQKLRERQQEQA